MCSHLKKIQASTLENDFQMQVHTVKILIYE